MLTIFISGSDTGIGKTRVAAAVTRLLATPSQRVQIVKPVETGVGATDLGDADTAREQSGVAHASIHTLFRFTQPLAPITAARADARPFQFAGVLAAYRSLPRAHLRVVEGAGGLAVPLDADGRDWADFAVAIGADRVVLVVPDRLGAINQARLSHAYARSRGLHAGIWLNAAHEDPPENVGLSTREALASILWASQGFGQAGPMDPDATRRHLLM